LLGSGIENEEFKDAGIEMSVEQSEEGKGG
jgi:hypothetical protein